VNSTLFRLRFDCSFSRFNAPALKRKQFLISTWSARDYAELRLVEHHECFQRLAKMAQRYGEGGKVDLGEWHFLEECKERDRIFEDMDVRWFVEVEFAVGA